MNKKSIRNIVPVKIAVMDSGVEQQNVIRRSQIVSEKNFLTPNSQTNRIHGTYCANIILNYIPTAKIYSLIVLDKNLEADYVTIVKAIEYAIFLKVDIINLSLGTTCIEEGTKIYDVFDRVFKQNIIIVAARDNNNKKSFPACFNFVVEVGYHRIKNKYNYIIKESKDKKTIFTCYDGRINEQNNILTNYECTSYATAKISGLIGKIRTNIPEINTPELFKILETDKNYYLKSNYANIDSPKCKSEDQDKILNKRLTALIYPLTEELLPLLEFDELLKYRIKYAIKVLDKHKQYKMDILEKRHSNSILNHIKVIELEEFEKYCKYFDVVINIESAIRNVSERLKIYNYSQEYNKNVLSLNRDNTMSGTKESNFTEINEVDYKFIVKNNLDLENYRLLTPIVGLFNTSINNVNLFLQLALKKKLLENNYKSSHLSSNIYADLFTIDTIFPFEGHSSVNILFDKYIDYLQIEMIKLDLNRSDIILVDSNSPIIPFELTIQKCNSSIRNLSFLLGTRPDVLLLSFDVEDSLDYILDSIKGLESFANAKIIALISSGILKKYSTEILKKIDHLKKKVSVPIFEVEKKESIKEIYKLIIKYFATA